MNCNTWPRHVESALIESVTTESKLSRARRNLNIFVHFCEKLPSRAIFLLFASAAVELLLGRRGKLVWGTGRILCRSGLPALLPADRVP